MTSNSWTENEQRDIPSHIWRPFLDCKPQLFFRPKYVWFPVHLKGPMIPDPSGQLAALIVYITSTRVDLYSHQILLHVIILVTQAWQELEKVVCVCLAISMIRSKSLVLHTYFKLYDGGQFELLNLGLQFISLFIVCMAILINFLAVDNFISNTFIVLMKLLPSEC